MLSTQPIQDNIFVVQLVAIVFETLNNNMKTVNGPLCIAHTATCTERFRYNIVAAVIAAAVATSAAPHCCCYCYFSFSCRTVK